MQTARRIITVEGVAMAWAEHGSGMRGAAFGVLVSGDLFDSTRRSSKAPAGRC